jgi:tetratricopeptide (TPR) repeat protein
MTRTGPAAAEGSVADNIKGEILRLGDLYRLDASELRQTIERMEFEHYAEYVFGEETLEIITGGVGREAELIALATALQVPEAVVTAFRECAAAFPRRMVYFKRCFGPRQELPTLYLNLMEPWESVFSFLKTLPEVRASLPALKQRLEGSKVCVLLAFSLDRATRGLLVKTYHLFDRRETSSHAPLMVSLRMLGGEVQPRPKYYKTLDWEDLPNAHESLAPAARQVMGALKRRYRAVYGYYFRDGRATSPKIYVFRKDSRISHPGPRSDSVYTAEGNVLLGLERFEDAIVSYTNAIAVNEKDFTAYANRALCHALLAKNELALEDARIAKALEPNMNFRQSELFFSFIKDVVDLSTQLQATPTAPLYNRMGLLLFARGLFRAAKKNFEWALQLDPRYAEAHNNLGGACINLGLFAEAFDHCGKAISLDDGTDATNYMMALDGMRRRQAPLRSPPPSDRRSTSPGR